MKVATYNILTTLTGVVAATPTCLQNQTTNYNSLNVALVRAPPSNWPEPFWNKNWTGVEFDLSGTVIKGVNYISEAAAHGANLIVFPELWFPGYPKGIDDAWISEHAEDYIANSITVGSDQWNTLLGAAKNNSVYVALAFSEKTNASIYMAQALISPYGELLHLRHKLRPSGIERSFWSDGTDDELKVIGTAYGRVGLLECWEHFHPSMTFPMQAQLEDIHIASWPYTPDLNDSSALYWESLEVNGAAARLYAVNSGAVLLMASVGYSAVLNSEGIVETEILASAPYDQQPILYASVNISTFENSPMYNVDGEQSWGVLKQIESGWPYYVPKVEGSYVEQKTVLITDLLQKEA